MRQCNDALDLFRPSTGDVKHNFSNLKSITLDPLIPFVDNHFTSRSHFLVFALLLHQLVVQPLYLDVHWST